MRRAFAVLVFGEFIVPCAIAQYGTAPSDYYPAGYNGATFTGVVTETKNNDQVTLVYTKGSKSATFIGRFESPCAVPGADKNYQGPAQLAIPKGTVMTAFYKVNAKKIENQKVKENIIIAISLDVWQGKRVAEDERRILLCTGPTHLQFRAWN